MTAERDWKAFVLAHGWRAHALDLAALLGRTKAEIVKLRYSGACKRLPKGKSFAELFSLWHGREPRDGDWPVLRRSHSGAFRWQAPELALLASLVGRLPKKAIARVLTRRLREKTGDRRAVRTAESVQNGIMRVGMLASDVVGGITAKAAGDELGSYWAVVQAISGGRLRARKVGKFYVIPHAAWAEFKSRRIAPPKGYVQLSSIRDALGIRSNAKLPQWAKDGHIPTAMRCNPVGGGAHTTSRGTWFVDAPVAKKLVADRRAGRPMPWQGKPDAGNLKATFKLWSSRQHPKACSTCAGIWGIAGAPQTFEDYARRYPPLAHGAKRHLTRKWTPGMTLAEVAKHADVSVWLVRQAIRNGRLRATRTGKALFISRTDATRWKHLRCASGESDRSWTALEVAARDYLFKRSELRRFIAEGKLLSKAGTHGAMRGVTYVSRHQCGQLREDIGFSEVEAARRVGVSVARFRTLLAGVNWRGAEGIPLFTVQAVIKRIQSREGFTIGAAAKEVGRPVAWVRERIKDGTVRVAVAKWDRRRLYLTRPMLERLKAAKHRPVEPERFTGRWLLPSDAAREAGVSVTTLMKWAADGELPWRDSPMGRRFARRSLRARAKRHWQKPKFRRAVPPTWMAAAIAGKQSITHSRINGS